VPFYLLLHSTSAVMPNAAHSSGSLSRSPSEPTAPNVSGGADE